MFKKTKRLILNRVQRQIEQKVKEHDKWLIDKVCKRIEYLALNTDYDLQQVIDDLKNGGYLDDKEKHVESN